MKESTLLVVTNFLILNLFVFNCYGCRSNSVSVADRWKDTGFAGWNNLDSPEGAFTKVLIGLGTGIRNLNNVEVLDLSSNETVCQNLPNFPHLTLHAAGGILSGYSKPVICGDVPISPEQFETVCYTYLVGHHEWHRSEHLPVSRGPMSASTVYQDQGEESGGLLLTGGFTTTLPHNVDLLTYTNNQLSVLPLAPEMPTSSIGHCSITLNSTTVLVTGGYNEVTRELNLVHFYHVDRQEWVEGPSLKIARHRHACTIMRTYSALSTQPKSVVVVAGGVGEFDENLKSVELLQEGEVEWTLAQDLPTPIRDSTMITDQDGGAVIIGGISPDAYFVGQLYRLTTPHSHWTEMGRRLRIPRNGHVAFKIPDDLTLCRKINSTISNENRNVGNRRNKKQRNP